MFTDTQLRTAANKTAWKTTSMRGFAFKTVLDAATYGDGAYTLTFREGANDTSGSTPVPVDYTFYFNVDPTKSEAAAAVSDADDLVLDTELLGHVLKSSWMQGTYDDFEAARGGTGKW